MKSISLQAYLFLIAVPLHLAWEVAQISAYDFPETSLVTDILGCFVPALGDGLLTLIIYWSGWLFFREAQWILNPGRKGYLFIAGVGIVLALIVELNALYRTGAWGYSELMVTLPLLRVGVFPLAQMIILPIITVLLLQQIWKRPGQTV